MRLWELGAYPTELQYDLIQNAWIALELWDRLAAGEIWPVMPEHAIGNEAAFFYLQGAVLKLLGVLVILVLAFVVVMFAAYVVAYFTYGRFISRRIFRIDPEAPVPAVTRRDDVDYVPTKRHVLFGHHTSRPSRGWDPSWGPQSP